MQFEQDGDVGAAPRGKFAATDLRGKRYARGDVTSYGIHEPARGRDVRRARSGILPLPTCASHARRIRQYSNMRSTCRMVKAYAFKLRSSPRRARLEGMTTPASHHAAARTEPVSCLDE